MADHEPARSIEPIDKIPPIDITSLREHLPPQFHAITPKLGSLDLDSLYPVGRFGLTEVNYDDFIEAVNTEIRNAAEATTYPSEYVTKPEMPGVDRLVSSGKISQQQAEQYKQRVLALLVLEPLLPSDNTPESLRHKAAYLALAERLDYATGVYAYDFLKDKGPAELIPLARKALAEDIVAVEEGNKLFLNIHHPNLDFILSAEEARAIEIEFPDSYRKDGYLRQAAQLFHNGQIISEANPLMRGNMSHGATVYVTKHVTPDRDEFLHWFGFTKGEIAALPENIRNEVDKILEESIEAEKGKESSGTEII